MAGGGKQYIWSPLGLRWLGLCKRFVDGASVAIPEPRRRIISKYF
jgi:hypothetical protein